MQRLFALTLFFLLSLSPANGGFGESAVTTLVFPYGARSIAMGEVGTALANDASALFFNPAGLGVCNPKWRMGSAMFTNENLLPAAKLGIDHSALSAYLQPDAEIGGFGFYANWLSGNRFDVLGRSQDFAIKEESVSAFGWGIRLGHLNGTDHYAGAAVKLFSSTLFAWGEDGSFTANSFAIDAGYKGILDNGLCFGLTLANMGPSIWYIDKSARDPIPFTLNAAIGYVHKNQKNETRFLKFSTELRLDKELVVNHWDGKPDPFLKALFTDMANESPSFEFQEINYHLGAEALFYNTIAYRQGILFDYIGERYEMHFGIGISLLNHLNLDISYIYAPVGYLKNTLRKFDKNKDGANGLRDGQVQVSFVVDAVARWTKEDKCWWKVDPDNCDW